MNMVVRWKIVAAILEVFAAIRQVWPASKTYLSAYLGA